MPPDLPPDVLPDVLPDAPYMRRIVPFTRNKLSQPNQAKRGTDCNGQAGVNVQTCMAYNSKPKWYGHASAGTWNVCLHRILDATLKKKNWTGDFPLSYSSAAPMAELIRSLWSCVQLSHYPISIGPAGIYIKALWMCWTAQWTGPSRWKKQLRNERQCSHRPQWIGDL